MSIEDEVTRIDKNGEKITKNISYIVQITDRTIFLTNALSNLVNCLSEGIHSNKCNYGHDDKKCETFRIIYVLQLFAWIRNFPRYFIE